MLFNSWQFVFFFALFIPIYSFVRTRVAPRNAVLLVASYIFYGAWDSRFLILVAISTSVDYCAALGAAGKSVPWHERIKAGAFLGATSAVSLAFAPADLWIVPLVAGAIALLGIATFLIDRASHLSRPKLWLILSLATNLGILGFFKYFNFFIGSLADVASLGGFQINLTTLKIILPVGLSFYTFQAISRTIDSYLHRYDPQYSLLNYAAYHAFFPQLVAGPIERAAHLMPQFERVLPINGAMIVSGLQLFAWGAFKKVVVADNVAPIADVVFQNGGPHNSAEIVAGIIAFTFQIYGDFSGYSDMARGLARLLGFDLMVNFNLPYFARTPSEFWRRWHISLSGWLRDYLYIPLGGNRGGEARIACNLMLTMLIGGLWHGAAWTFVIWGGFHGAIQVLFRALRIDRLLENNPPITPASVLLHVASWAITMMLVMVGWVFFRARSFTDAMAVLHGAMGTSGYAFATFGTLLFYITPLIVVEFYQRFSGRTDVAEGRPFVVRYTMGMAVVLAIFVLGAAGGHQFIYFDF